MTQSEPLVLLGTGTSPLDPARLDTGALSFREDVPATETGFALIDTIDGRIAASGRLLISTPAEMSLIGERLRCEQPQAAPDFLDRMPEGAVTGALSGTVPQLRALMTVARGTALRQRLALVDDEGKTVLRCDLWDLRPEAGQAVSVAVLVPLRGYDKALRRIARQVGAQGTAADPARAAALLRGEDPAATGKAAPAIREDQPAFEAAAAIIREQIAVARSREAGTIADIDTEFLHDYRVALRRVRSVVSLFKGVFSEAETARLKTRFGAIMARTGRLRDLDVYLLERAEYIALVPESRRAGLSRLFDRFAEERADEQAKLAAWLGSKGYLQEIGRLERLFAKASRLEQGPLADRLAPDYARALIWKRYRKVCKLAAHIQDAPDEQVHELRIHCKKLRYLMEFFAPLFGASEVKSLIKSLKRLQDNLGLFNDYSVQQVSLEEAQAGIAADPDAQTAEIAAGIGALVAVLAARQAEERARVAASFARFDSDETRAAFRKLFKPGEDAR
ncbi:CHAD domain-containing protein [Mangrovicoccus algicola]|uniref:CHAD domain-containing protein n=1 Tax=Mangrovicoccus algicola TaxID=2771008 RepID=A0A8J6YZU7_9RHOB|nr:CHAD domain-containing protein [Mangrovicoccus algicola]MBE3639799.1 CHAD domain-containing protein [Mangrovicoccus algicola]